MSKLSNAKNLLLSNDYSFVCINDEEIHMSTKQGIAPILELMQLKIHFLNNASVADKVIGKAAALLLIKAGIKELYAGIISEHAVKVLEQNGITVQYDTIVPYIINRRGDGMCPMETTVLEINSPEEAYTALQEKVKQMMSNSN